MIPGLSEKAKNKIKEIIARYPQKQAAILPVLRLVKEELGFIDHEAEKFTAALFDVHPIRVREIVTFYSMLNQSQLGKYHIQVCSNLSCSIMGAQTLIEYLSQKLGIKPGGTTKDKKFTLSTVECLGACEKAPCMMINFEYYGNLTREKIDDILNRLE
ncbi:MAG: NADH-quinone oxidoreductase subunit NuoE [Candidatus Aminicenantes bacterium]|nr:NADH-quinone oxidoreductase subunit NuoE [Candidatus Aminicenantes bacterium]